MSKNISDEAGAIKAFFFNRGAIQVPGTNKSFRKSYYMVLAGTFFFITTVLFISVLFATSCLPDDFLEVLQPVTKIKKPIRVNDNKDFITYIFVPPQGSEE